MNNFIFENSSKVYFGEGCVKEYLSNILSAYGDTVMLCYGGGSIKKNGIYDEVITVLKKKTRQLLSLAVFRQTRPTARCLMASNLLKKATPI